MTEAKESIQVFQLHTEPLSDVQFYAFKEVSRVFGEDEWYYFERIINKESNWIHTAQNPNSSASGLGQFLSSTYEQYGGYTDDPYRQIDKTILYIQDRYTLPSEAWKHHLLMNWY